MKKSFKMMKIVLVLITLIPLTINAKSGCCSHHGGVAGCHSSGKQLCKDGTLSPSCTCTPKVTYIYGCTDPEAKNYNYRANKNNGKCEYYIYGCTDKEAKNYNEKAEKDDDSCEYYVYGCTDKEAKNYNENAEKDDDSCEYYKYGCMDKNAINYDKLAEKDDDSCEYEVITNNNSLDTPSETSEDDSSGIGSLITLGGIGAAAYYMKKKK